jgi:hypothetical protein
MTSSSFHDCDVNVSLSNNLFTFVSVHNARHINRDTRFLFYRQMMCVFPPHRPTATMKRFRRLATTLYFLAFEDRE